MSASSSLICSSGYVWAGVFLAGALAMITTVVICAWLYDRYVKKHDPWGELPLDVCVAPDHKEVEVVRTLNTQPMNWDDPYYNIYGRDLPRTAWKHIGFVRRSEILSLTQHYSYAELFASRTGNDLPY